MICAPSQPIAMARLRANHPDYEAHSFTQIPIAWAAGDIAEGRRATWLSATERSRSAEGCGNSVESKLRGSGSVQHTTFAGCPLPDGSSKISTSCSTAPESSPPV